MNSNNLNNQKAKNIKNKFALSTTSCISTLCKDKPLMVIQTKCGVGKYQFKRIGESEGKLYIEFELIHDQDFKDCEKISHYLGNFCYLSTQQ